MSKSLKFTAASLLVLTPSSPWAAPHGRIVDSPRAAALATRAKLQFTNSATAAFYVICLTCRSRQVRMVDRTVERAVCLALGADFGKDCDRFASVVQVLG
jgi:hypothetical protein